METYYLAQIRNLPRDATVLHGNITHAYAQNTPDDSWFYCKQVKEMPVPTLPGPPQWSSPCRGEGAYPPRSSDHSVSKRKVQPSVAAKVVQTTDLLNHDVKT